MIPQPPINQQAVSAYVQAHKRDRVNLSDPAVQAIARKFRVRFGMPEQIAVSQTNNMDPRATAQTSYDAPWLQVRYKNMNSTRNRVAVAHELAHQFDRQMLTDADRAAIQKTILGVKGPWRSGQTLAGNGQQYIDRPDPAEMFAEYAAWAAVMPRKGTVEPTLGTVEFPIAGGRTRSLMPSYGVRLDMNKLRILRQWLENSQRLAGLQSAGLIQNRNNTGG